MKVGSDGQAVRVRRTCELKIPEGVAAREARRLRESESVSLLPITHQVSEGKERPTEERVTGRIFDEVQGRLI